MVSIPACHAGDRGSIPRLGVYFFNKLFNRKSLIFFKAIVILEHDRNEILFRSCFVSIQSSFFALVNFIIFCEAFDAFYLKTQELILFRVCGES